ncbi:hypothetical protein [Corynebacterium glyciniphilum]|uniref:hypothetical protein n=1 Tax=Corynebacterium glyciniphilum TaxID=1404244 RepID=UPI003FD31864
MATGYARGGVIQGGQSAGVGYDPDADGPLIDPAAHDRWARRELDRLNQSAPVED